jgi:NAD(P)-dependent dehydrogenase (short-subunit alcohol dehydrogenase family)
MKGNRYELHGSQVILSFYRTNAWLGPYAASKAAIHGKLSTVPPSARHTNALRFSDAALSDTLAAELASFNIRVLLVSPGSFRTEGIYSQPYHTTNPIPSYDSLRTASIKRFASVSGTEKGDPGLAMEAVVDVVRQEGVAKGKPWPGTLVLGEDAELDVREKCEKLIGILDEWGDVARGVSFKV